MNDGNILLDAEIRLRDLQAANSELLDRIAALKVPIIELLAHHDKHKRERDFLLGCVHTNCICDGCKPFRKALRADAGKERQA